MGLLARAMRACVSLIHLHPGAAWCVLVPQFAATAFWIVNISGAAQSRRYRLHRHASPYLEKQLKGKGARMLPRRALGAADRPE